MGRLWKAVKATAENEKLRGTKDYFRLGYYIILYQMGKIEKRGANLPSGKNLVD
jgi:hypothetical protein